MARTVNLKTAKPNSSSAVGVRWWLAKGSGCADSLFAWLDQQRTRTTQANLTDLLYEAIYTARPIGDVDNSMGQATMGMMASEAPAGYLNVIESVVDTLTSKLGKRRPMPVVSADDADHSERIFAKRASRVIRRKMGAADLERMFPATLMDQCVRGTSAVKTYAKGGDVTAERCPRHEFVVDRRESRYGDPRTLVHVKSMSAELLAEKYPKAADAIAKAAKDRADEWQPYESDAASNGDMIQVAEGWRLPSDETDGSHVIVIRGKVIYRESWKRPAFPVVFSRYKRMPRGFWGKGLVEILAGMQGFINSEFKDIQEAFYWCSGLTTFSPRGSAIVKNHLVSRGPKVVEHDGAVPQFITPQAVSPQRLEFFFQVVSRMYEIAGISQLSASSKNPLGSDASGKAIDTMYDIESDRFSDQELEYAWLRVEVGKSMLRDARDLVSDYEANKPEKGEDDNRCELAPWITEVGDAKTWDKFDIDAGTYHLIMEAENFVPDSRSGRLSTAAELGKAGLNTDPVKLLSQFEEPDMQRMYRSLLAPYNAVCAVLERVGNPSEHLPPVDPQFAPYDQLLEECKNEHFDAISAGADDEHLQRFRDFQQLIVAEKTKVTAATNAMMPPAPGGLSDPGQAPPLPVGTSAMPIPGGPGGAPPLMPQGLA